MHDIKTGCLAALVGLWLLVPPHARPTAAIWTPCSTNPQRS